MIYFYSGVLKENYRLSSFCHLQHQSKIQRLFAYKSQLPSFPCNYGRKKYGVRDYRGAEEALPVKPPRVVAGAVAKQMLSGITITAYVSTVGDLRLEEHYSNLDFYHESNRYVATKDRTAMEDYIKSVRKDGDTVGGSKLCGAKRSCWIGRAVFDKLAALGEPCYPLMLSRI